ncbi:unnamed protein product [Meganyctiphanes norvegica]|uniref:Major facilitator superfamily associated domain-containing protein n=1 Tax=Meganyctiphanes norvegica TaxID=48144 RepID=A0AAV2PHD0_MEGNR
MMIGLASFFPVNFFLPFYETPIIKGQLRKPTILDPMDDAANLSHLQLVAPFKDECYIATAWDCIATCSEPWRCLNTSQTIRNRKFIMREVESIPQKQQPSNTDHNLATVILDSDNSAVNNLTFEEINNLNLTNNNSAFINSSHKISLDSETQIDNFTVFDWSSLERNEKAYTFDGAVMFDEVPDAKLDVSCEHAEWVGESCSSISSYWGFWIYVFLLMSAAIFFASTNSVTDAICCDSIKQEEDYGLQRAWGTVGWGLMGPVSGSLVDWYSGTSLSKDYTPAFLLFLGLGSIDVFICALFLKVPQFETDTDMWTKLKPILKNKRILVFFIFFILNGCFDGLIFQYLFILQEDMAKGTWWMQYIAFIQGFTLFVQCSIEAVFMFSCSWFMKRFGAQGVISLVFFLYIFRIFGHAVNAAYGNIVGTLVVELLNGPCYGLGYTAVVVFAGKVSVPGTSSTVQSVVNICYESIGYALSNFFGGILYSLVGGPIMYSIFGCISVVTFIMYNVAVRYFPPPLENDKSNQEENEIKAASMNGDATDKEEMLALNSPDTEENTITSELEGKNESSVEPLCAQASTP